MDITPVAPAGRPLVQGYGRGFVRILDQRHQAPVLVTPTAVHPVIFPPEAKDLQPLWQLEEGQPPVDLLLLGRAQAGLAPAELRSTLAARRIRIETMDLGAACRTFNILLLEDRRIAALLVP